MITDLLDAALLDVPAYGDGVLTVTLARPGGTVACALLVVGVLTEVGDMEQDAEVSIKDYSVKDSDPFSETPLLEREFSKRLSGVVVVPRERVDSVVNIVSRYRATYLVFIGSQAYGCTVIYGFLEGWKMVLKNAKHSKFSVQIEGGT